MRPKGCENKGGYSIKFKITLLVTILNQKVHLQKNYTYVKYVFMLANFWFLIGFKLECGNQTQ